MKHKDIIEKLTLRQKCDLLTGADFWSTLKIADVELPSAFLSDGPHGLRKQAAASDHLGLNKSIPATCFPTAATMANTWNPELGERVGTLLAKEAISMDVNMILGPGTNIKRNPLCGRNFEYFSEDPLLAGKMAASYIRGIQSQGIAACVKHFAANNQEFRRMTVNSEVDERTLREIYLMPFELAVKEGHTKAIMSSYNRINGEYANESIHLLRDILRNDWGFEGVVVSDWAGCNDRVAGVIAGSDLEMPSCKYGADDVYKALTEGWSNPIPQEDAPLNYEGIQKGIKDGKLDEAYVDECLDRLIEFILTTDKVVKEGAKTFDVEEHHQAALQAARESIVLLKNDNNVLPLSNQKVCIIGDFAKNARYQGAGSSVVNPTKLDNVIDLVSEYELDYVGYEPGFKRYGNKSNGLASKAVKLASKSDVVIFFAGLDEVTEAEGLDRTTMTIPTNQLALLEKLYQLNKKVVVVLSCGSAVLMNTIEKADAIIHAYLGGQAGAKAVLDVLCGKVNPSGKLSESLPGSYDDNSSSNYFPARLSTRYKESIYVGYRYYDTKGIEVKFPFGHGLSYTTYEYKNLSVNDNGVSFDITNTGNMDGYEVAQLYIGKKDSKVFRAAKELKGFKKVFIKAGETVNVSIDFDDYSFRVFNPKKNCFEVEDGQYEVYVGKSSKDIVLEGMVSKAGAELDFGYDTIKQAKYFACDIKDVTDEEFENLVGRKLITDDYVFYKKNRMVIHENATVEDLKYSRGWIGRAFSGVIRFATKFLWAIGAKTTSNTLVMGVLHQPVRGVAKFGGMNRNQMEGLLLIFNGHFGKGVKSFFKKEKKENKGE